MRNMHEDNNGTIAAIFPTYRSSHYNKPIGGGEISNRALMEELVGSGWNVHVITQDTDCSGEVNGVMVHAPICSSGVIKKIVNHYRYKKLCAQVLKKVKPNAVLVGTSALSFARSVLPHNGIPVGLFVRAFENFHESKSKKNSLKSVAKSIVYGSCQARHKPADFYIFNSLFMKNKLAGSLGGAAYVVYPPLDVFPVSREINEIARIHMVGMTQAKGFDIFNGLAKHYNDLNFKVFGKKDLKYEKEALGDNIKYMGWLSNDELYSKADVFLVPSKWEEPFGRVSVEALSRGCIVLVSNVGGLPETVGMNRDLIVDPNSLKLWEEKLDDVRRRPDYYCKLTRLVSLNISKYSLSQQSKILSDAIDCEIIKKKL